MIRPWLTSFVIYFPRILGLFSTLMTLFALYVILCQSPVYMKKYKYVLIAITLSSFNFDIVVSVLAGPTPLVGSTGTTFNGVMGRLWPSDGNIIYFLIIYSFTVVGRMLAFGFCFREYVLTSAFATKRRLKWQLFHAIAFLPIEPILPPIFFNIRHSDTASKKFLNTTSHPASENLALWVLTPSIEKSLGNFVILCIVFAVFYIFLSLRSTLKIYIFLKKNKDKMSSETIQTHKMLLRALFWQTLVPISFFFLPTFFGVIDALVLRDTIYVGELGAVGICITCLFSPIHIMCTLYFTTPYKKFCFQLFHIKDAGSSVVVVASVNSITTKT